MSDKNSLFFWKYKKFAAACQLNRTVRIGNPESVHSIVFNDSDPQWRRPDGFARSVRPLHFPLASSLPRLKGECQFVQDQKVVLNFVGASDIDAFIPVTGKEVTAAQHVGQVVVIL